VLLLASRVRRRRRSVRLAARGPARARRALVHDARDAVRLLLELLDGGRDGCVVLLLDRAAPLLDELAEGLLERVAEVVELVPALDLLAALLVLGLVLRGLLHHLLDLGLAEAGV